MQMAAAAAAARCSRAPTFALRKKRIWLEAAAKVVQNLECDVSVEERCVAIRLIDRNAVNYRAVCRAQNLSHLESLFQVVIRLALQQIIEKFILASN